jgi:prepilin-type N-terminal cleavage/methylation domain-containing protein
MTHTCSSRESLPTTGVRRGFTLIELMVVVAVMIVLAGAVIPAFGSTLARSRIQSNVSQMVQDLRLVRDSAIVYQQNLWLYVCTGPAASDRTTYYYELSQKDPLNGVHYTPADAPVSGKFVSKTLLYGMRFEPPFRLAGAGYTFPAMTVGGKTYLVLVFCCGKDNNFRGQSTRINYTTPDDTTAVYTVFSSSLGIPVYDAANARRWYAVISPNGQATSSATSP